MQTEDNDYKLVHVCVAHIWCSKKIHASKVIDNKMNTCLYKLIKMSTCLTTRQDIVSL